MIAFHMAFHYFYRLFFFFKVIIIINTFSDIEKAVNLNISEAKIVRVEGFKLKEIIDYRRDDYPELIENRPAYVRD